MKTLRTLILAVALVAGFALAAEAPVVTSGPVLPWRVQVDLSFDTSGETPVVSAAVPQVFYRQVITVDGTEIVRDHGSVSWDSVAKKDLPVTIRLADGTTATTTRGAVLAAVVTIAAAEKVLRDTPPEAP